MLVDGGEPHIREISIGTYVERGNGAASDF